MEYVIKEIKEKLMDNYLKDVIECKGISVDDKLKIIRDHMNDELKEKAKLEKPTVKRLGDHIVIMGENYTDEQLVEVIGDTFMNSDDDELRLLAGKWLLENVFGKAKVKKGTFGTIRDVTIDTHIYLNGSQINSAKFTW